MTERIKRIIASVLCVSLLSTFTVFADTSEGENAVRHEIGFENTDIPSPRYGDGAKVYAGFTPDYKTAYSSYEYNLFMDILKEYASTHLYEFTEEQALDAFIRKLLKEKPELIKMYIHTLLGTMDEYSGYYEAGMGLASDGSALGYGVAISNENNYVIRRMGLSDVGVYVTDVTPDSPAAKAGISPGDRIMIVQDIPVSSLTYDAATYLIRKLPYVEDELFDLEGNSLGIPNEPEFVIDEVTGLKLYPISMVLKRPNGEEYTVKLTRGPIIPSSVAVDLPENKSYAYIQISEFRGERLVEDFRKALDTANKAKRSNLIIDLRDNGGGVLEYAVQMANMLISEPGRILYYTNSRANDTLTVTKSVGGGDTFDKITVLINRNSASASELFAMILRFNCGATLVGEVSFGKAVGQSSYTFSTGDMFTITTFELLDPTKKTYNRIGLIPDVECSSALKKSDFPNDLEIFNYINYKELSEGTSGDVVMGLERRLGLMGFIRSEYIDGSYDEHTTAAIKSFKMYYSQPLTDLLTDVDVDIITAVINKYKNNFYYYDAQLEVAEMSFSSKSQAKRRAKEIAKEHAKVALMQQEYEKALIAELEAREKAEKERLEAEKANSETENTQVENTASDNTVSEAASESIENT